MRSESTGMHRRVKPATAWGMAMFAALAGCATASNPSSNFTDDVAADPDAKTLDESVFVDESVVDDAGAAPDDLGTAPLDTAPATDTGGGRCTANIDCPGTDLPVCDPALAHCVQCLPGDGVHPCARGSYCTASDTCAPGCASDTDCAGLADGGLPLSCNVMHQCTTPACRVDDDCPPGNLCRAGHCAVGCTATHACATGQTCCGGACADLQRDAAHCGSCATVCSGAHATPVCTAGACHVTCAAGFGDCDGNAATGCEASVTSDPAHCGSCTTACTFTHGMGACAASACVVTACDMGYQDCDHDGANGCESNPNTDVMNCGRCGMACTGGMACTAGVCGCPAGQGMCHGACVSLQSDALNCGMCNLACPSGQFCVAGACVNDVVTYNTAVAPPASVVYVDVCGMAGVVHQLAGVDDAMGTTVTLPFPFRLFDGVFTQITRNSKGWIGFGASGTILSSLGAYSIPDTTSSPRPSFMAFANDLVQGGGMCFATVGTAPNRSFIWHEPGVTFYSAGGSFTWELFLNEADGSIDVLYPTVSGSDGSQVVIGMLNASGMRSYAYDNHRAGSVSSGLRLRFRPGAP